MAVVSRYAEMSAVEALLFYSMFVMSTRSELVVTIPLVLFGVFRYRFLADQLAAGESPTDALNSDVQLLAVIALWGGKGIWFLWPVK